MSQKKQKHKLEKEQDYSKLKTCKGYENISEEEAEKILDTLEQLSLLIYQVAKDETRSI